MIVNKEWKETIRTKIKNISGLQVDRLRWYIDQHKHDENLLRKKLGVCYGAIINGMVSVEVEEANILKMMGLDEATEEDIIKIAIFIISEEENGENIKLKGQAEVIEDLNNITFEDEDITIENYWKN